jgi:hypothetical protein
MARNNKDFLLLGSVLGFLEPHFNPGNNSEKRPKSLDTIIQIGTDFERFDRTGYEVKNEFILELVRELITPEARVFLGYVKVKLSNNESLSENENEIALGFREQINVQRKITIQKIINNFVESSNLNTTANQKNKLRQMCIDILPNAHKLDLTLNRAVKDLKSNFDRGFFEEENILLYVEFVKWVKGVQ